MKKMRFAVFAASLLASQVSFAETSIVQTAHQPVVQHAAGYYPFQVGIYKVFALRDGSLELNSALFSKNLSPEDISTLFAKLSLDQSKGIQATKPKPRQHTPDNAMHKLAAALMQLGAALCLAPVVAVLLGTGALLPLFPWGVGLALLGLFFALAATSGQ